MQSWSRYRRPRLTPDASWLPVSIPLRYPGAVVACWAGGWGGDRAQTLVVFECSPAAEEAAAIECWQLDAPDGLALELRDAWYSRPAMPMAPLSRHSKIRLGAGLPGLASELRTPIYLNNLGLSGLFVRSWSAMQVHLHHGLALPSGDGREVLVFMTGQRQLAARRIELSVVHGDGMHRLLGFCEREGTLPPLADAVPLGAAELRACADAGVPALLCAGDGDESLDATLQTAGADALLALPFAGEDGRHVVLSLWL